MDASNLIKPALASGELRCIGSTTFQEYRGIFEKDRALAAASRRSTSSSRPWATCEILQGLKSKYELHHGVTYTDEALQAAVDLSVKHIGDRLLPDKAIDVIDEAGARQRLLPEASARS
jgi:ATP-dependent Clp protease ATP-binding subunit ClpA